MAYTLNESLSFTGTGTATSVHQNTTASNMLLAVSIAVGVGTAGRISTVTDSSSNVYTKIDSSAGNGLDNELWVCSNGSITNATTLTITPTVGTDVWAAIWALFTSGTTTNAFDRLGTATTGANTSTSATASTAATRNATEIVIAYASQANNRPFNAGSGFTSVTQGANGATAETFMEYMNVSTTGTQTATTSWDLGSAYVFNLATFSDTAIAGGGVVNYQLMMLGIGT